MKDQELNFEGIEKQTLRAFTEKAYLDYSMYVILDRALPHIGDGLKPVQRRIVYAMSELGLAAGAKHKKSARTVGDVIGKFHPHGDSACYEAMVHMAQDFAYRYPDRRRAGQLGIGGRSKILRRDALHRVTAHPLCLVAVAGIGAGHRGLGAQLRRIARRAHTAAGTRAESAAQWRARGSLWAWPPIFRRTILREVVKACVALLEDPELSTRKLMAFVKGPDLPTGAEIVSPRGDLVQMYETGTGGYRARATYEVVDGDVIIEALPFQVSGSKVLEQIANQMRQKKLPMVEDLRDESDHENPTRLVIVPKSNRVDIPAMMAHLVCDHRSGAHLPRQFERHQHGRPSEGDGSEGAAAGVARVPDAHGDSTTEPSSGKAECAPAYPRWFVDRVS